LKRKETVIFIIPAFNEEKNITRCITSWAPVIKSLPFSEMLVVNDGSTDKTKYLLGKLKKKYKFLKIINKINEGHGKTIRSGYDLAVKSKHFWVFQTDSDCHFTPSDFYKLWDVRNTSPFILGHRERRDDPFFRKILTAVIKYWITLSFRVHIKDANIPFRLIKTSYLRKLLPKVKTEVFAPNIHLSILAAKDKINLHHIPVEYRNPHKKTNGLKIFNGALQGFFELVLFSFTL